MPAATSNVTTYTAGRRALGLPVRPTVVSTGSADRFAERLAARRHLMRRKSVLIAAAVAAVAALAWLLLLSPVLALEPGQVELSGAGTVVAAADVTAVVAQVAGVPLPRIDTVGLRDQLLEVPGVREAKVTRDWPHGLTVALVSREPVAAVPLPATTTGAKAGADPGFTLLDTDGFQVGWAQAAPEGLPVVSVPIDGENQRILTAVLAVLQALPESLRAEVATVSATSQDTVQMGLRDGASVSWGSASEAPLKIAVLQALRAAPATAGAKAFDVSAPTLPITR
ncbi:cell division protein FtsQ/DivIB [Pengzhenrongella sicca]|uniref:Cell division protein FtsQ/DivIB n=1 Tax=Pengzhenrongella sicca TaxID=2819238 RepID=A0A8A4ZI57_9MICO|nr:cell division protein FtsQ/DivIB [Pengzhenrongella sicca]QTE30659.1 cell division protein FtsQ/DivIB [Pengzhenrongella sicca]